MERLNTRQALAVLGWTHRNTLYQAVRIGLIPQHKERGRNYYLRHELEAYLTPKPVIFTEPSAEAADPEYMARITRGD